MREGRPQRAAWQVNAELPNELSDVIDRLLEKRPSRRFASALAVRDALTRILQQLQNRRPSMSSKLQSWTRRNIAVTLALAATVAVLASLLAVFQSGLLRNPFSILALLPTRQFVVPDSQRSEVSAYQLDSQSSYSGQPSLEIDPKDRTAFTQEIRELHQLLDDFESSHSVPQSEVEWSREIRELHSGLDRLELHN